MAEDDEHATDDPVGDADLGRSSGAAYVVVLALWALAGALVLLAYASAWRAQAAGDADQLVGEVIDLGIRDTFATVMQWVVLGLLVVTAALWVRWTASAARNLQALGDPERPSGPGLLRVVRTARILWRSGGEAARPAVFARWTVALPLSAALPVLLFWPEDYDTLQWVDLATAVACVPALAAAVTSIGVARQVTERQLARARAVMAAEDDEPRDVLAP